MRAGHTIPLRIAIPPRVTLPLQARQARALTQHAPARAQHWIGRLTFLSLALLFGMSAMLLTNWNFNYEMAGGSILEKMHPGTWMAFAAAGLTLAQRGLVRAPFAFAMRHPWMVFYLACWFLLLAYIMLVQKLPFTPIIDTFFLPIVIVFLLDQVNEPERQRMAGALHIFMAINSLIGLGEVLTGLRVTPYIVGGEIMTADWRATALLGHPLANACLTGTYALILATGGARHLQGGWRSLAMIGALIGMVAFGGRAAMVFLLALVFPFLLFKALKGIAFGRMSFGKAALGLLVICTVPVIITALAMIGAFDKFIGRFIDDKGSASTRIAMFQLFDDLPLRDILLGPHPDALATLQTLEGLDYGIESFWIATILFYGAIVSVIFFIGLFCYCCELVRFAGSSTWLPLLYFFGVASTSVSLSAKSCILAMFSAIVILMADRKDAHSNQQAAS
ncbi:MAG: VpsF family polysaccharide biosynthesis protein [Beijerinckiaceae bacterium]